MLLISHIKWIAIRNIINCSLLFGSIFELAPSSLRIRYIVNKRNQEHGMDLKFPLI